MRHFWRCTLIAMVASLCAGGSSAETIARVGVAARDLGALDPAYGIGNGDEFAIRQIYNTLVSPPDGTTKIQVDQLQGELAEKWEVSPDVGSGPFEFVGYEPKQKVVTRAFDQYWGGKPKVDRLEVLFLTETAARTLAFVKGDVDIIDVAGNVDALIDPAHQEVDDAKRLALLKEIQMQILRQVPVVPLPSPAATWVHNPRLDIGFPVKAFMGTFTLGRASVRQ